jgi:hypothetical protein
MSATFSIDMMCDRCGTWDPDATVTFPVGTSAYRRAAMRELVTRLRARGWKLSADGLTSLCPDHVKP